MLITFLQEVMCVISGFDAFSRLQNYLSTIQPPNTFEHGRNATRYDVKLFSRVFSAYWNRQKNKNIQPLPENKNTLINKSVSVEFTKDVVCLWSN